MKKRIIIILSAVIAFYNVIASCLDADEIRLKSGIVIHGKIIQVTPEFIEYDPAGSRKFDIIDRLQVSEIVYDDGTKIKLK